MLLRQLPLEARTVRALAGDSMAWDTQTHLLAALLDATNAANWQRGRLAGGKGKKPKPVPRPGDKPPEEQKQLRGTPVPIAEARRILDDWSK